MLRVDLNSAIPLQEQIRGGFHQLLLKGQLKPGDPLPIDEELAAILLVNPATVARAYQQLIKERFIERTDTGGLVVSTGAQASVSNNLAEIVQELFEAVQAARNEGLSWEQIESVLETLKQENVRSGTGEMIPSVFKRLYYDSNAEAKGSAICPYCRERVSSDTVCCFVCRTLHHAECWNERGHCSVFGCKGRIQL